VGLDYVPVLLEAARARAGAERLEVECVEGDAEQFPFEDASCDAVLSARGRSAKSSRMSPAASTWR
jgi:ubiquinone/menaquinone biosynthesis C-methylase UbiE